MKKTIFTLAVVALLAGVCSCTKEKEGVYNPKQKIQSVYLEIMGYQDGSLVMQEPKFKSEVWTWNDNRLERISYYEQYTYYTDESEDSVITERELAYTQLFTYDKNDRLTLCETLGEMNLMTTYTYDGNYLETLTISEGDIPMYSYRFNRTDKKVTSINVAVNSELIGKSACNAKASRQLARTNPLRFVMAPEMASRTMAATQECTKRLAKKGCTKDNITFTLTVEWDGDNISKFSGSVLGESMTMAFKYDNKNNPYYGLFDIVNAFNESVIPFLPMSQHNITNITMTYTEDGEAETESEDYTYTYNGKDFPTSKTIDQIIPNYDWVYDEETGDYEMVELGDYRYVQTQYYEYQ